MGVVVPEGFIKRAVAVAPAVVVAVAPAAAVAAAVVVAVVAAAAATTVHTAAAATVTPTWRSHVELVLDTLKYCNH